jgi:cytoskeletal protein RodZ
MTLTQSNVNSILLLSSFGFTPNITCTDCMHGAITMFDQSFPGVIPQSDMDSASAACGPSFVDGGIPPGLIQTASGASNSTSSPSTTSSSTATAPSSTNTSPSSTTSKAASPSASKTSSALGLSSPSVVLDLHQHPGIHSLFRRLCLIASLQ